MKDKVHPSHHVDSGYLWLSIFVQLSILNASRISIPLYRGTEQYSVVMRVTFLICKNYEIYLDIPFSSFWRELDTPYNYSHQRILRVEREFRLWNPNPSVCTPGIWGLIPHKIQTFPKISFTFKDKPQLSQDSK